MKRTLLLLMLMVAFFIPATASRTVYFDNSEAKWDKVMVFWWGAQDNPGWGSGQAMTSVQGLENVYTWDVPDYVGGMLFYNGNSGDANQTSDISNNDIATGKVWSHDGSNKTAVYLGLFDELYAGQQGGNGDSGNTDPQPQPTEKTVYYDNAASGWTNVYIHYWDGGVNTDWPGVPMNLYRGKVYSYTVPVNSKVIFNCGEGGTVGVVQTKDILDSVDGMVYDRTGEAKGSIEGYDCHEGESTDPDPDPDPEVNYPDMYVVGAFCGWTPANGFKFTRNGNQYTVTCSLDGEFKISNAGWTINYGSPNQGTTINASSTQSGMPGGENWVANSLSNVTISFTMAFDTNGNLKSTDITFAVEGGSEPEIPTVSGLSGTLPVLYINIKNEDGTYNNEIIDRNLAHKNYFTGEYWLDVNGCQWMIDLGATSVGSAAEPLPLEVKARGNYTRTGFSKKPFKLKLGKKQNLLNIGNDKSKHWAILTHADDNFGYLRNFVGFNLGKRMRLPWVPQQQPIEVVINGNYRGLYFLTESIRVGDGRVMIEELADNCEDIELASGGYLVELDNYDEPDENQIRMEEKTCTWGHWLDKLRVTFNTPELYSPLQRRFVTEQFSTMNDLVGANSDDLWRYMDLDDAARYYVVEEIMSHTESYHGSTYMFRDRGEGQKWHFSPLWDFGNAFNGSTTSFFYNDDPFGNTWIPSMRCNAKFNDKVRESWLWFMSNCYDGLMNDINEYVDHIREAAKSDRARWKDEPLPSSNGSNNPTPVIDNSNMSDRRSAAVNHLNSKINWLKGQFGDYTNGTFSEPVGDTTEAAPLPSYLDPNYQPAKLYVYNDANWNGINAYVYLNGEGDNGGWPGATLNTFNDELVYTAPDGTTYTGLYVYELPDNLANGNVIFSEANGSRRYPADQQPGININGSDYIFFTSWQKIEANPAISKAVKSSGTLPVVKIDTADGAAIGYGDEGKVNATISIDPLETGATALAAVATEIKGRGDSWNLYDKKSYKLKLGAKAAVLDMNKSKHWVLMPYVEDTANGLVANYAGHALAEFLGLTWTADLKPVELILNGQYKGLYFIGENVRADSKRVAINDFGEKKHVAGEDWLIEVDNLADASLANYSWADGANTHHVVSVAPEWTDLAASEQADYAALLAADVEELLAATAAAATTPLSTDWTTLIDLEQAARFYIVNEIMDCADAYSTSLYMYHTSGSRWCFGPVWNFNGAFASGAAKSKLIHNQPGFDGAFIASLYANKEFRDKVIEVFDTTLGRSTIARPRTLPGAGSGTDVLDAISALGNTLRDAIAADAEVWPDYAADPDGAQRVVDLMTANIRYLAKPEQQGGAGWSLVSSLLDGIDTDSTEAEAVDYDVLGRRIENAAAGTVVIRRQADKVSKTVVR